MQVLGIDPIQRLVVPRIVAAVVVSLFLNVLICAGGLVGGYFFSVYLQGVTPGAYVASVPLFTGVPEFAVSMVKAFVFGLIGLVVGILSDLMYVFVDPRIDFESREG